MEHSRRRIVLNLVIAAVTVAVTRPTSAADPDDTATPRSEPQSAEATILAEYRNRRAALNVNNRDQWYDLARWLDRKDHHDLALEVVNEMIRRYPDDNRGLLLRNMVLGHQAEADNRDGTPGRKRPPSGTDGGRRKDDRLTHEQINLIKVWELDVSTRPRVVVPRKTIDDLFRIYAHRDIVPKGASERRRFRGLKDYRQAHLLIKLDARDLLAQIQIKDEPAVLQDFRKMIHQPYVISYCGTRRCHGDDDAAAFRLIRTRPKDKRTAYTNFFILNSYESPTGYMIDRPEPESSLLIQYGLLPDDANVPHPKTDGWRPYYRNRKDPRFTNAIKWVGSLAEPLRMPNYGVSYVVPPARKLKAPPAASPDTNDTPPAGRTDGSTG